MLSNIKHMNPLSLQNFYPLLPAVSVFKNRLGSILLILVGSCIALHAQGQADKRLQLADQYFSAGEYYTAAGLYEQFLNPKVKEKEPTGFPLNSKKNRTGQMGSQVSKLDILYKQAESYRLANYWPQASARYKECFEKDSVKYAAGLYWYAACQRSMGSYAKAEESVKNYINTYSSDTYQQAATQELATIQYIKGQITRPDSVLYHIQKINTAFATEKGIFSPVAAPGNKFLITSTQADSITKTGVNPFHNRLFYATFSQGNMQDLEPVVIEGMDATINQATASISANGNYLYFTQWKKDKGQNVSSIYYATKKENGWSNPVLLSSLNLQGYSSKQPFCSADGKYLYFASDRPGGQGQFDIWYAALQPDGTATEPINAGEAINGASNEQAPFYHSSSNSLVFSSDRKPGMGGYDLFTSKGDQSQWASPENMGHPVNSSRDDLYFFAAQKDGLLNNAIITSDRGSECCLETYVVNKMPKQKIITGVIRDCRNNEPLENAEIEMKSSDGRNWRMTTGEKGAYEFEWIGDLTQQLFVSKELYKDNSGGIAIEKTDESGWLVDIYTNADICLDKKLVIRPETVVTLYFDFDKSDLKNRATTQLDSIYHVLIENPNATIQVSGFTDGRGTVEYNKVLSDKRARACADYLIERGVDTSRISFESFGACCPVEMEMINGRDNADGRSKNRRALINITKD